MAGRFTSHRPPGAPASAPQAAPSLPVEPSPPLVPAGEPAAEPPVFSILKSVPEVEKTVPAEPASPLLSDKFLDAKVRLHRRLIEEINLSALEKLPEDEMKRHIQQLVTQYIVVERLAPVGTLSDFRFSWRLEDGPWSPFTASPTAPSRVRTRVISAFLWVTL